MDNEEDLSGGLTVEQAGRVLADQMLSEEPEPEPAPEPTPEPAPAPVQVEAITNAKTQLEQQQQAIAQEAKAISDLEAGMDSLDEDNRNRLRGDLITRKQTLKTAYDQFNQNSSQLSNYVSTEREKILAHERKKLEATIPNWDSKKEAQVIKYLKKQGYTETQLANVADHRFIANAYKAMQPRKPLPKVPKRKVERPRTTNLSKSSALYAAQRIKELL